MDKKQIIYTLKVTIFVTCVIGLFTVSPGISAGIPDSESYLKQTITSLHKTRNAVVERYYLESQENIQTAEKKEDIQLFISYLDGRIYHYCRTLFLESGPPGLKDLPCPANPDGDLEVNQFDSVPELSGQTSSEKVAQLDRDFNTTLGEFDDMLLKEQEGVAAHIPKQRESGGSGNEKQNGNSSGRGADNQQAASDKSGEGRSGKAGSQDSAGQGSTGGTNDGAVNEGAGSTRTSKSQLPPTDGPRDLSEADDDIVARQLREAAEQETDPEVKEKLWEEYRKYKEGIK